MASKNTRKATAAFEKAELYYAAHPRSPSAVRRPALSLRSATWVALLGSNIEEGIVGFGATIEAALRAFDAQYLAALRPATQEITRVYEADGEKNASAAASRRLP